MVKSSTQGIEAIKELFDSTYSWCNIIEKAKYHQLAGTLFLGLYEEENGVWHRVICQTENKNILPSIRIRFFNAINFAVLDRVYGRKLNNSLYKDDQVNRYIHKCSLLLNKNTLIIDECKTEAFGKYQKIDTIQDLDFGSFALLKSELLIVTNPNFTDYYCNNPNLPIDGVFRVRNYARLFRSNEKEEVCYRTYNLHDFIYCHVLEEKAQNPDLEFSYEELIFDLDFEGTPQREGVYTSFRDCITNDFDRYYGISGIGDIVDHERDVNMYGPFQIGVYGQIRFPRKFLNEIKCEYLEKRKELEKKWNLEEERNKIIAEKEKLKEEQKRDFNLTNYNDRDSDLKNNNSHYFFHDQQLFGTTRVIANFFPKFDAEYWAEIKAPLMGKTPQQLLDEWDRKGKESSEAGTKLHQRIDEYYHHKEVQAEDKEYLLFKQFANAYKLNPYRSEWAIYDEDSGIVGVVDMLDYSNGEYILYDWKRSEKVVEGGQPITKNKFDEYGLKPIENVPNTDYWHYALQLSFYRYILEKNYGIRIKESRLVVLHPTLNLPVVLTTPYMIDEVNKIIAVMKM